MKHNQSMKRLAEMQQHLASALRVANNSLGSDRSVSEAKSHIRSALHSIEKATKKETKRSATPQTEWSQTIANVAQQPLSPEAGQAIIKNLDSLIKEREDYLAGLNDKPEVKPDDEVDFRNFDILNG